jgi:hypothetical protein
MSSEHPALKNFSPTWEGIKHIGGKALKWAAVGAIGLAVLPALLGAVAGSIPLLGGLVGGSAASGAGFFGLGALQSGAIIGGVLGGILGVADVGKAVDERKQDAIADFEQAIVSRERAHLMAQQRGQGYSGGVSPSSGYGRARGQGAELQ